LPFLKKLSTIGIITLNPFIYRLLRPLLLVFINPFADRRFRGFGGAKKQPQKPRKKTEKAKQKIKNKTQKEQPKTDKTNQKTSDKTAEQQ
jgi:hypothetical protein